MTDSRHLSLLVAFALAVSVARAQPDLIFEVDRCEATLLFGDGTSPTWQYPFNRAMAPSPFVDISEQAVSPGGEFSFDMQLKSVGGRLQFHADVGGSVVASGNSGQGFSVIDFQVVVSVYSRHGTLPHCTSGGGQHQYGYEIEATSADDSASFWWDPWGGSSQQVHTEEAAASFYGAPFSLNVLKTRMGLPQTYSIDYQGTTYYRLERIQYVNTWSSFSGSACGQEAGAFARCSAYSRDLLWRNYVPMVNPTGGTFDLDLKKVTVSQVVINQGEPTQSGGDLDVVANKDAHARAFVTMSGVPPRYSWDGMLRLYKPGWTMPTLIVGSYNGPIDVPGPLLPEIEDLDKTLNFKFRLDQTWVGTVRYELEINPDPWVNFSFPFTTYTVPCSHPVQESDKSNNTISGTFDVRCLESPRLICVPLAFPGNPAPTQDQIRDTINRARRLLPFPRFEIEWAPVESTPHDLQDPWGFFFFWQPKQFARWSEVLAADTNTKVYFAAPGTRFEQKPGIRETRGVAYPLTRTILASAGGPSDDEVLAHELLHTTLRERTHLPGPPSVPLGSSVGMDVERVDFTRQDGVVYTGSVTSLLSEDPLSSAVEPNRGPWISRDTYRRALDAASDCGVVPTTIDARYVFGVLDSGQSTLRSIQVSAPHLENSVPTGEYLLRFRDGGGSVLLLHQFDMDSPTAAGPTLWEAAVPWDPLVDSIELEEVASGQVIVSRQRSANPPDGAFVGAVGPILQAGAVVSWATSDPDGGLVDYVLSYSPDGGQAWVALDEGQGNGSYTWDPASVPASTTVALRLSLSDGFNSSEVDVIGLTSIATNGPSIKITAPMDTAVVRSAQGLAVSCQVWDLEDDHAALEQNTTWSAVGRGVLASGTTSTTIDSLFARIGPGTLVLTAQVMDSDGNVASDTIKVFVLEPLVDGGSMTIGEGCSSGGSISPLAIWGSRYPAIGEQEHTVRVFGNLGATGLVFGLRSPSFLLPLGGTVCKIHLSAIFAVLPGTNPHPGEVQFALPIPNAATLIGSTVMTQAISFGASGEVATSPGFMTRIGQ